MYCRNCGNEMNDEAVVCVKCGVPAGKGTNYCPRCGAETNPDAVVCVHCGMMLGAAQAGAGFNQPAVGTKSKLAAGLLGIFLGSLGIHNFYLGFTKRAVIQLLLGTVGGLACGIGTVVSGVWGLVEGIMYLSGSKDTDASGAKLKD